MIKLDSVDGYIKFDTDEDMLLLRDVCIAAAKTMFLESSEYNQIVNLGNMLDEFVRFGDQSKWEPDISLIEDEI